MPRLNLNHDLKYQVDTFWLAIAEIEEEYLLFPVSQDLLEVEDCELPFRESMKDWLKAQDKWWENNHYPKVGDMSIWSFARKIVENNVGKSFSNAYSYYCKKVNVQHQKEFLDYFKEYNTNPQHENYWIENDIICVTEGFVPHKRYYRYNCGGKKPIIFYSSDYSEKWRVWEVDNWLNKKGGYVTKEFSLGLPYNISYKDKAIFVSSKGFKKEFESKQDREFKRLHLEKRKAYRKLNRQSELKKKEIVYSLLSQSEIALKKAKLDDENILLRHGFDDDSFKGYHHHGRKNKKK